MPDETRRRRLLIVDDEKELIENLEYDLKPLNSQIQSAKNGKDALCHLAIEDFDCILSDIKMPVMDGISFADRLRLEKNKTPIIFYTAHGNEKLINQMNFLGPVDIIHKPYDKDDLIYLIEEAFCLSDELKKSA